VLTRAWLRLLDRDEAAQLAARISETGVTIADNPTLDGLRATAKRLKLDMEGARLSDIRIHDLRRTMGSWQARTGATMLVIGKSLGHKSQQATAVYAHLDIDPVRSAMETAAAAMLDAGQQLSTAARIKPRKLVAGPK
jgi:integrase